MTCSTNTKDKTMKRKIPMARPLLAFATASTLSLFMASTALAQTYRITITNTMAEELIAPILIVASEHDQAIFSGNYVTPEAEVQVLTGDPGKLVARIGADASVAKGNDGPPGVLLAPGKSVTFNLETQVEELRFFAMVAPTMVPDHYLSALVDLSGLTDTMMKGEMMEEDMEDSMSDDKMSDDKMSDDSMKGDSMTDDMMSDDKMEHEGKIVARFSRYDIGHDEGTRSIMQVEGMDFGMITIEPAM